MLGLGSISIFIKIAVGALGVGMVMERALNAFLPDFLAEPSETEQPRPSWSQRLRSRLPL